MTEKLPGVEAKIEEYVSRIQNGEDKEYILQGLGPAFREPVEARLVERAKTEPTQEQKVPVQLPIREQSHLQTMAERKEDDEQKIRALKKDLGVESRMKPELTSEEIDRRKKLSGWIASYELARIAKAEGIDLSTLSREAYVDFAIDHYLAIEDSQLRAAPWQRMAESVDEIVKEKRSLEENMKEADKEFHAFSYEMKELAHKSQTERYISEGVRVLSGTKDSDSWLHFAIGSAEAANEKDMTYKSYVCLKDLSTFSPKQFKTFLEKLSKEGYQGQVKTFQDLYFQGLSLNDQIVMHGNTEADSQRGLQIAMEFFGDNIASTSFGADEKVEGKNMSYSVLLSERIKREIQKK